MPRMRTSGRVAMDSTLSFIPCVLKELPDHQLVAAAQAATTINPANRPPMAMVQRVLAEAITALVPGVVESDEPDDPHATEILTPGRLAVLVTKYWGAKGVKLTVGFMEVTPIDLRDRILSHMNAWNQYANIAFAYSATSPQVRITRSGDGYWSYLGTDVLQISANEPTMCLEGFTMATPESEYRRVVRHETGHTCGFPHEHMRDEIVARLDPDKTYAYGERVLGWGASEVRDQILTPLSAASIRSTPHADQDSIMCYQLPAEITRDGQPIRGGLDIDPLDGSFAASLYPRATPPPPPPPPTGSIKLVVTKAGTYILQS